MAKSHQEVISDTESRMLALHTENESLQAQADAEDRELSDAEVAKIQANSHDFEKAKAEIDRRKVLMAQSATVTAPAPTYTSPTPLPLVGAMTSSVPALSAARHQDGPKSSWGWRSIGEFVKGVVAMGQGRGADPRFQAAATTYGNEGTTADGGAAVPPDFREAIWKKVSMSEASIAARTDNYTTSSNKLQMVQDNVAPWTASGIQTEWLGEGTAAAQTKPVVAAFSIDLYRLACLVPLTDELLEDTALSSWLPGKIGDRVLNALNLAIVNGSGSGQPTGIIGSAGEVVAAAVSGQGANTFVWKNAVAMYSKLMPQLINGSEWLIHPTVLPQLLDMSGPGTTPVWLPPGSSNYSSGANAPAGTLLGRPVYISEYCAALGTKGDVILWNPKTYVSVQKAAGLRQDTSMHFFFDQFVQAVRVGLRFGGKSTWAGTVTARTGSGTYGNVICLNATRT